MCTAITYKTNDFYFGRTLDNDLSFDEKVVITPRNYQFNFLKKENIKTHYAIIGMACVIDNYPLYYEAMNEKGLAIAGLNFLGNTVYHKEQKNKDNICQYEFIPWILSKCASVNQTKDLLQKINFLDKPFKENLPLAALHWLISDGVQTITVESVIDGVKIYNNQVGVLTNNPSFDKQIFNLNNYLYLSNKTPLNTFSKNLSLQSYSNGLGGLGLPGDLSSQSRFVRASFIKENSISNENEKESVNQFFHILNSVQQPRGCCLLENGNYEITIYTSCLNLTKKIYYYTTYDNFQINGISLLKEDLNQEKLIIFPLLKEEKINFQN